MGDVVPIRNALQLAGLELHKKFAGRYWFCKVETTKDRILIYFKKGKDYSEWLGNDDTYKGFKYKFLPAPEPISFDIKLREK